MVASLAAAFDMAKKSKGKGGRPQHEVSSPHGALVHPSFPPQAAEQPSYAGSQSMAPSPMQGSPEYQADQAMGIPNQPLGPGGY